MGEARRFLGASFPHRGMFRAAFSEFSDVDALAQKIESDLRRLIELRIAAIRERERICVGVAYRQSLRGLEPIALSMRRSSLAGAKSSPQPSNS